MSLRHIFKPKWFIQSNVKINGWSTTIWSIGPYLTLWTILLDRSIIFKLTSRLIKSRGVLKPISKLTRLWGFWSPVCWRWYLCLSVAAPEVSAGTWGTVRSTTRSGTRATGWDAAQGLLGLLEACKADAGVNCPRLEALRPGCPWWLLNLQESQKSVNYGIKTGRLDCTISLFTSSDIL